MTLNNIRINLTLEAEDEYDSNYNFINCLIKNILSYVINEWIRQILLLDLKLNSTSHYDKWNILLYFSPKLKKKRNHKKNPKKLRRTIYQKPTREISKRDFSAESKEFLRGEEEEEDKKMEGEKNIGFLLIA